MFGSRIFLRGIVASVAGVVCFAGQMANGGLVMSEILYDVSGGDNGLEWIELFNSGPASINLGGFSLGSGGSDYTNSTVQLDSVMLGVGSYFVVGGPSSNVSNANPVFDQLENFSPDLQNGGATADGIALFDVVEASIGAATVPIQAVIYGTSNSNMLIDESGVAGGVDVGTAAAGSSLVFDGTSWSVSASPSPGGGSLTAVPEPSQYLMLSLVGIVGVAVSRTARNCLVSKVRALFQCKS